MAKIMKVMAIFTTLMTVLFAMLYFNTKGGLLLILTITFGTTAYHFLMRLFIGSALNRMLNNHVNYRARWFRVGNAEKKLYGKLKVKKWKSKMGTYDPSCFDPQIHSWDEIAQAGCQAELVHELIIVFSFIPLLAAIYFGAFAAFLITSLLAACFDSLFVIMQRYNRPRIISLIDFSMKNKVK